MHFAERIDDPVFRALGHAAPAEWVRGVHGALGAVAVGEELAAERLVDASHLGERLAPACFGARVRTRPADLGGRVGAGQVHFAFAFVERQAAHGEHPLAELLQMILVLRAPVARAGYHAGRTSPDRCRVLRW